MTPNTWRAVRESKAFSSGAKAMGAMAHMPRTIRIIMLPKRPNGAMACTADYIVIHMRRIERARYLEITKASPEKTVGCINFQGFHNQCQILRAPGSHIQHLFGLVQMDQTHPVVVRVDPRIEQLGKGQGIPHGVSHIFPLSRFP